MTKSKVKCPKCRSIDLTLIEIWNGSTITWEQINGEFNKNEGNLEPGDAHKVQAKCNNCHHWWTVRNALQIDDIIIIKEDNKPTI